MAITKNKQSNEKILEMTKVAFPSKKVTNIKELTEGMCNVGFLGDTRKYSSLFEFTKIMLTNLIKDAEQRDIDIVYDADSYLMQLENDRTAFEEISFATLVHWDLWEGNVFIDNGHVSGIIDWERALWGEAFMDDRFRYHNREKCFLTGFGKTSFSENEFKRIRWYDIILYLTMMIEVYYREHEDKGQYMWAKDMLMGTVSQFGF